LRYSDPSLIALSRAVGPARRYCRGALRQRRMQYKSPLLQSLQSNLRLPHLGQRTEAAYAYWIKRFVRSCESATPLNQAPPKCGNS